MALDFESAKDGDLTVMSNGAPKRTFKFDVVFGPQDEQGIDAFMPFECLGLGTLNYY